MNSLKKKFGKFAVSQTKAKEINGGVIPEPSERFWCVSASGSTQREVRTRNGAARFIQNHGGRCSAMA